MSKFSADEYKRQKEGEALQLCAEMSPRLRAFKPYFNDMVEIIEILRECELTAKSKSYGSEVSNAIEALLRFRAELLDMEPNMFLTPLNRRPVPQEKLQRDTAGKLQEFPKGILLSAATAIQTMLTDNSFIIAPNPGQEKMSKAEQSLRPGGDLYCAIQGLLGDTMDATRISAYRKARTLVQKEISP